MITPNIIAYLALLVWPLVIWHFYSRLRPERALIWSVLGAYMLLPERVGFDFPVLPDLNKNTLPVVLALLVSAFLLKRRLSFWPDAGLGRGLLLFCLIAPFVTVLTNPDPIYIGGGVVLPGMRIYDSVAAVGTQSLYLLPFFLARRDLATLEAMTEILRALMLAALIYALPMIFECLFSPQLHTWLYGFFQHDFIQSIRFGGYRPFVFMPHGLWVAFFAVLCLMASAALLRQAAPERRPLMLLGVMLCITLVALAKSFGPFAYAALALPLILLLSPKRLVMIAAAMSVVVILYPLLRGAGLVPVDWFSAVVADLSQERSLSLIFRLENEEALLARAAERPLFGWGGYGRNFLFDPDSGELATIADGAWIIRIGSSGWLGFIAEFGLLALPLWLLAREAIAHGAPIAPQVAVVALMLGFNMVDLLPNATMVPLTWLCAGALLGHAEVLRAARRGRASTAALQPAAPRTII